MSTIYFSPMTRGFYFSDVHSSIPDDKIVITQDQYDTIVTNLAQGQVLNVVDGVPTTIAASNSPTWDTIRKQRDNLLSQSDYTQLADASLTDAQKAAWKTYRQALRDLPDSGQPSTVVWPTPPSTTTTTPSA